MSTVDDAATLAWAAFRDYSRRPGAERAQLLRRIADCIERLGDALIETASRETSLPLARLAGERARTTAQLKLFADLAQEGAWTDERIDPADPSRKPIPKPRVRSAFRPLGPVAVFGASNFPLAFSVAGGDTAAALAVGCTVIVKAHPGHPRTSQLVGDAIRHAMKDLNLPAGVFSLLFETEGDETHELARELVGHPLIKAGAFTGSTRGGLALWRIAQSRPEPIPFFAEMGSVNPVFLFPKALENHGDALATSLHASITGSVGQLCTQPGLIFLVDSGVARALLTRLSDLLEATPPGVMLTPSMLDAYRRALVARGATPGVDSCAQVHEGAGARALLHVTDSKTFILSSELKEEIFGPASLAVLCPSVQDFLSCAESLPGQLTASVYAEPYELDASGELLWTLEQKAGRLIHNGLPTGVEVGTAMMHGGPFPATTDSRFTSVGTRSIFRFVRPVAWQSPT